MKVVGVGILSGFSRGHADVRSQVDAWLSETNEAQWKGPEDVRRRYAHASFMKDNRIVFNLKGNRYRLDVSVSYKNQVVVINRIGTHAEYSKWEF